MRAHDCRPTHIRLTGKEWAALWPEMIYLVVAWTLPDMNPAIIYEGNVFILHWPPAGGYEWEALEP